MNRNRKCLMRNDYSSLRATAITAVRERAIGAFVMPQDFILEGGARLE